MSILKAAIHKQQQRLIGSVHVARLYQCDWLDASSEALYYHAAAHCEKPEHETEFIDAAKAETARSTFRFGDRDDGACRGAFHLDASHFWPHRRLFVAALWDLRCKAHGHGTR